MPNDMLANLKSQTAAPLPPEDPFGGAELDMGAATPSPEPPTADLIPLLVELLQKLLGAEQGPMDGAGGNPPMPPDDPLGF